MKVLLGIGGTEDSVAALEKTVERCAAAGHDLTVAIVDNPASDAAREEIERTVREALGGSGLDADVRHVEGDPGGRLVEIAEREGFDEIALGGGETSPMGKIRIGSVAEFVLVNSHVTVTLVR